MKQIKVESHSVHPPRVEPPSKFLKRRDLTRSQFLEGRAAGKEGVTFFKGGGGGGGVAVFALKKKKKFINKMFLSVVTKNLNWEILT